ncbi:MAG: hypothetical protein PWQ77_329 [Kosmotogales bacterium]|nr:hypothetical protein [Kosmotogales bacterium]
MRIITAKRNELEIVQPQTFTLKRSERLFLNVTAVIAILCLCLTLFVFPFWLGNVTEQNLDKIRLYQRDMEELSVYISDIDTKISYYGTMNESVGF